MLSLELANAVSEKGARMGLLNVSHHTRPIPRDPHDVTVRSEILSNCRAEATLRLLRESTGQVLISVEYKQGTCTVSEIVPLMAGRGDPESGMEEKEKRPTGKPLAFRDLGLTLIWS